MRPASLRGALLLWLIVPLLCLWLASSLATLAVSRHMANDMYDEELLDTAGSIDLYARTNPGADLREDSAGIAALLFDATDRLRYAIVDDAGRAVAGSSDVPRPRGLPVVGTTTYFDAEMGSTSMRWVAVASTLSRPDSAQTWIIVGETLRKRQIAAIQAIVRVAIPQLALAIGLAILVWFGIERGLRPLRELQQSLRSRSASDLRPLSLERPPREIQAVVDNINALFQRLAGVLSQQSAFIGDAAHQLRTPLAALKASVTYARRHRGSDAGGAALHDVAETADRCVRVVNQLLTLARADAAQSSGIPLQRLDLKAACDEIAVDHIDAALARDIDLGVDVADHIVVLADATLLREALGNLIDNAVQYAKSAGRVTVRAVTVADIAEISVSDDGPGVAMQDREEIFERFHRGTDSSGTGSGLGLPIAKLCARAMAGDITLADTKPGSGATFVLHLRTAAAP
jgi:two-component system, OmpR family, sensor histidine kinase TctE